jgi:hypothetical protein
MKFDEGERRDKQFKSIIYILQKICAVLQPDLNQLLNNPGIPLSGVAFLPILVIDNL